MNVFVNGRWNFVSRAASQHSTVTCQRVTHAQALMRAEPSSLHARIRCDSGLCTVICQHEKET